MSPLRLAARRASKYHAQRTDVGGVAFASKREAARYAELRLLERAGEIRKLELQPKFPLCVTAHTGDVVTVGSYRADFRYETADGTTVVEDVKGGEATRTTAYRLRKRMVEALYGIQIVEV